MLLLFFFSKVVCYKEIYYVLKSIPFPLLFGDIAVILNNENASVHIDAVIDPLSASGQKLSTLLRVLWKMFQPSLRLVLNPIQLRVYSVQLHL